MGMNFVIVLEPVPEIWWTFKNEGFIHEFYNIELKNVVQFQNFKAFKKGTSSWQRSIGFSINMKILFTG